ncbi:HAD-IIB family hydrolase [Lichenibacterium dinghuense]|uniref:HAD-IIB family hydrolase n=1 Tax=Lichenibacterium dinghuense TaxID=2895977 RepID=UPI001F01BBC0|nr:HAD-IIB family hydrolase [Lichenibacterium sp. 6Y81]
MRPLEDMPEHEAARVRLVLTDIDDTMTHEGRLPAEAYRAVEDLSNAGFVVAPITGRPAGWCDLIARIWPVAGIVGENGALYFAYDRAARTMRRAFAATEAERAANRARLEAVKERVLAEVPGSAVSADQAYREADLAIDFCEDVAPLGPEAVARIKAIFEEMGAVAKVSSIHVNGWFGQYDKLSMTRRFARDVAGLDVDRDRDRIIFVGDSPNDAPMFGFFPNACGVAGVRDFAGRIDAEPAYVTRGGGGRGFVEIAKRLLAARAGAA